MRSRSIALIAGPVVAVLALVAGVFVYDGARGDTIAKGVTVGGVNVGGMSPDAARAKLKSQYLTALTRPVVVHWDTITWQLGAREAKISANVDAMVQEAVDRSGGGNAFSRSIRRITGGSLDDADLRPQVSFSDPAVIRLLDRVRAVVDRKPQDAKIDFTAAGGFTRVQARVGLKVDASALHKAINAAITSTTAERTFVAHTSKTQPKVTDGSLSKEFGTVLVVDRSNFKLKLFKHLQLFKTYGVAVGQQGLETPAGLYHITNKQVNPAWSVPNSPWAGSLAGTVVPGGIPSNPLKARWLGIFDGAGIHGTSDDASIGSAASHGCVRMHVADVIDLYDRVPVGAPIYIS